MTETAEQLRRLKNTIMGVSYRLQRMAAEQQVPLPVRAALRALADDLAASSQRLGGLLAVLDQAAPGAGVEGTVHGAGGQHRDHQEARRQDEQHNDRGPAA